MKRGTDHIWKVVKYKGDVAIYAKCRCGFQYNCGTNKKLEDGSFSLTQVPSSMYPYCPWCGARKKLYNEIPEKIDKCPWDGGEFYEQK